MLLHSSALRVGKDQGKGCRRTHEEQQARAIVEEVGGGEALDVEAVAQAHPEEVQHGRAQQRGHVHEGVEEGEGKAAVALGREALDGDRLHGRAQAARDGHRAQQRPKQHTLARRGGYHKPAAHSHTPLVLSHQSHINNHTPLAPAAARRCWW